MEKMPPISQINMDLNVIRRFSIQKSMLICEIGGET